MSEQTTYIDLVRHGRVLTPDLFCAPPDEPLSREGWEQLVSSTRHARADVIISSPSRRCQEFAVDLARSRQWPVYSVAGFQEMNFGRWLGQSTTAIWQQDARLLKQLWESPLEFTAPGGEALVDFSQRVLTSWFEMLTEYRGRQVLLFTHGGVIRVVLAEILKIPYQNTLYFDLEYGSVVRTRVYADNAASVYGMGLRSLA